MVNAPVTEGIALIRAPLAGPSRAARAEQALKATSCGPYTNRADRVTLLFPAALPASQDGVPVCSGISLEARRSILTPGKMMISPSEPSTRPCDRICRLLAAAKFKDDPHFASPRVAALRQIAGATSPGQH